MTIGERIKRIRTFRCMTQAELGAELGFEEKNRAVRIAQYESNYRVPKSEMIMKMAEILNCNYKALCNYDFGSAEDIIETLFWLEEANANSLSFHELYPVSHDRDVKMTYNERYYSGSVLPVAVIFNYGLVNDFLYEWSSKKEELKDGIINADEYFDWKITWPHT